ncbi:MAG: prepilin-type N-terminal cleavage/methylation domain-containing protein [Candidatus Omnitrophica bacterium]|nr:prepilin-type N-terminal cleavage/methylation domain-containing protein [Candidatus Omnitrophota bacterium]
MKKREAFTLIELIIVVVIIGILALIAIPKYFANVAKAQKKTVYANLHMVRNAMLGYYAVYGIYPNDFPVTVTLDGEDILAVADLPPGPLGCDYQIWPPNWVVCYVGSERYWRVYVPVGNESVVGNLG